MWHIGGGTAGEKKGEKLQPLQAWQSDFRIKVLCKRRGLRQHREKGGRGNSSICQTNLKALKKGDFFFFRQMHYVLLTWTSEGTRRFIS